MFTHRVPGMSNIAITGKMGAGKTTVADYLVGRYGYRKLSLADPLKTAAAQLWSKPRRDQLQALADTLDPRDLVHKLFVRIHSANNLAPVVVDDLRMADEYWDLRERGWFVGRVEASEITRVDRLMTSGKFGTMEDLYHRTETSLDDHRLFPADFTIDGGLPKQRMYDQADRFMTQKVVMVS